MKITYSSKEDEDFGMSDEMSIYDENGQCIDQESVYPLCECPEDAIIGRSLISCEKIISLMKRAYEAGKNGENFVVENMN